MEIALSASLPIGVVMPIVVVTGMPGSGKEEFVQVALKRGYQVVRMGDVVREEAKLEGTGTSDQNIGGFAHSQRQSHGYDIWAKRAVRHVKSPDTVIDGCRGLMELAIFRKELGDDVVLLAIHSSPGTRFPRLRDRGRTDAPTTWEEFENRDHRELGWGLGSLIATADRMIVNEGSLEEFKSSCAQFLDSI